MPAPTERIFRKVALERLASPDQLDRPTSPIGWAALLAIAVSAVA